jgi:hypothetical protein
MGISCASIRGSNLGLNQRLADAPRLPAIVTADDTTDGVCDTTIGSCAHRSQGSLTTVGPSVVDWGKRGHPRVAAVWFIG